METVAIGCRLPNGLRLEIGFSVNDKGGNGAPFAMVRKHENYAAFTLRGTNQSLIVRDPKRKPVAILPNSRDREPYINQVPKDFWEAWKKANAKSWHLTSGNVFEIPKLDALTTKAATIDAVAKSPAIFQPLDQSETMKIEEVSLTKYDPED